MKKFFLGSIVGSVSMLFVWMYIFRWSILEGITGALDGLLSEKRMMDRHERMARKRRRAQGAQRGKMTLRTKATAMKDAGYSNAEIADVMNITESTVRHILT